MDGNYLKGPREEPDDPLTARIRDFVDEAMVPSDFPTIKKAIEDLAEDLSEELRRECNLVRQQVRALVGDLIVEEISDAR